MKKYLDYKSFCLVAFFLILSSRVIADQISDRVNDVFLSLGESIGGVEKKCGKTLLIFDVDETLLQEDEPDLDHLCAPESNKKYLDIFYERLASFIADQPSCYVVYITGRPHLPVYADEGLTVPERVERYLKEKTSAPESYKDILEHAGIDLAKQPEKMIGTPEDGKWIACSPLFVGEHNRKEQLPKPDALITGCGSYIQVGDKLSAITDNVNAYNQTVKQWVDADSHKLNALISIWDKWDGWKVMLGAPAALAILRPQSQQAVIPDTWNPNESADDSIFEWPTITAADDSYIQNLSITKGYALQWLLLKLKQAGLLDSEQENAICIGGDSEHDLTMLRLDLRGNVLKSRSDFSVSQEEWLKVRLPELGISEEGTIDKWMLDAWKGSVIPYGARLSKEDNPLAEMVRSYDKIKVVNKAATGNDGTEPSSKGVLPMFELMASILSDNHTGTEGDSAPEESSDDESVSEDESGKRPFKRTRKDTTSEDHPAAKRPRTPTSEGSDIEDGARAPTPTQDETESQLSPSASRASTPPTPSFNVTDDPQ